MKFILFPLVMFVIGCIFYGIAAGIQTVVRSAVRLTRDSTEINVPSIASSPPTHAQLQTCLHELQELHSLFQNGVLSLDKFGQFKQYLLSTTNLASMPDRNQHEQ